MTFLVISILFMSALAVVLRVGVNRGASPLGMNLGFRGASGLIMAGTMAWTVDWSRLPEFWGATGLHAMAGALCFWLSGFAAIKAVQLGRLGVTWTVLRCSMVIATIASLVYWREVPFSPVSATLILRLLGIGLSVSAVVLLGMDRSHTDTSAGQESGTHRGGKAWAWWLAAAFLGQGGWELALRATRSFPDGATRTFFTGEVFLFAFLLTLPVMGVARTPLRRVDLIYGVLAGLCSLGATVLRVWALRDLDGILVFPATTISVMILVQLASTILWHEKIGRLGKAGFAAAILGILCLTLKA